MFCILGALFFIIDLGIAIDMQFGEVAQGKVTEFTPSLVVTELQYRYAQGGRTLDEQHHYHFPETFFIPKFRPGEPIEIRTGRHLAQMSAPGTLVFSEALFALMGLVGSLAVYLLSFRRPRPAP